jgi:hypothetical protein
LQPARPPGVIICTPGLQPARPQALSFVSRARSPQSPQGVIIRSEGLRPARPPGVMRVCGPALQPSRHPCVNICISGLQPASPPGVIIWIAGLQPVRPPGVIMCWYVSVHHASPCHAPCCPTPHTAPRNCEQHAGIPPQVWNTRLYKQEADCSDNEGVEEVPTFGEGDKKFASFLVFGCSVTFARTVVLGPQRCVRQFPFVVLLLCVATSDLLVM